MLWINDKEIDLSNNKKDYEYADVVADFNSYIGDLRNRFGSSVVYVTRQKPVRDPKTNNLRPVPLKSWPKIQPGVRMTVKDKDGQLVTKGPYTLVWNYENVEIEKGVPKLFEKNFIVKEGLITVDLDARPDFAYFLQFHNVVRSGELSINDPARTATDKVKKFEREQKVRDALFSQHSPLNKNVNNLRTIARRWGLQGVDSRTPDEIRVDLFETVMGSEERRVRNRNLRGIDAFLSDTNLGAGVKAGELVVVAEEKGVLKYNATHGEYEILMPGRQVASPFFPVAPERLANKREALIEALVLDDPLMMKLEAALGLNQEEKSVYVDLDTIDEVKYQDLQKIAASLGLKAIGKNKDELKEMIIEKVHAGAE
jgi:hypothetical protein